MSDTIARSWIPQLVSNKVIRRTDDQPPASRGFMLDTHASPRTDKLEGELRKGGLQITRGLSYAIALARDLERQVNELKMELRDSQIEAERLGDQVQRLRGEAKIKASRKVAVKVTRKVA